MSLSTPIEIRTLPRKLYTKAKQEPAFRFYTLYDKLSRADILSHAYDLAKANTGAPVIDGRTFAAIEAQEGKTAFVAGLQEQLTTKTYRADAVRRVWIPESDGNRRPLGIPTIQDRVSEMTGRRRTPVPLPVLTGELNRTLRGWSQYFHYQNSSDAFKAVKMHAEQWMRTQLRRRYKLHSRAQAYSRFPGRVIYERIGLFKLPTTAGWCRAHATV